MLAKLLLLVISLTTLISQQNIELKLLFGVYIDDQAQHTFQSRERIWHLKNNILDYSIDAHNTRYADTLYLSDKEMNSIFEFIENKDLLQPISKDLKSDFFDNYEYKEVIKGSLEIDSKKVEFDIKTNSPSMVKNEKDLESLFKLEQLLYQIVDEHNK